MDRANFSLILLYTYSFSRAHAHGHRWIFHPIHQSRPRSVENLSFTLANMIEVELVTDSSLKVMINESLDDVIQNWTELSLTKNEK